MNSWAPVGIKTEPNSKGHQTLKKFTPDCCGLDLSMVFLVKSELGKKARRLLSTKSLCPCIVLSFKCTAKAPLIIKDWFKRPFHNLSKQWAWLMLHILSSCHLLLLCVFTVPLTPPQYQPKFEAEQLVLWGWWHNCNSEPSNSSLLIDCKSTTLLSGSEPKQPPPKAVGQIFADFLNGRHLYITRWNLPLVGSKI